MRGFILSVMMIVGATLGLSAETFEETLHNGWWQGFEVTEEIYRDHTEVQDVRIFDNPMYGRVLTLDGVVQLTEADEYTYHEMMAHVPLFAHGNAKKVLIIGGGDGGCMREVLLHDEVEEVVLIDIDRYVIELSKKYFPKVSNGAFEDPRSRVVIADGAKFVKETDETFDVIICDTTDPIGPGEVLFTSEFYSDCSKLLNADGIMVNQHGVPFTQMSELTDSYQRRLPYFKDVSFYTVVVPTYVGGIMTIGWAANSESYYKLDVDILRERLSRFPGKLKYYSAWMHFASFVLPPFMIDACTTK